MKSKARLHFLDAFKRLRNLHPDLRLNGSIVCAVSGGIDSICLLSLATELSESLGIIPVVAHLDHNIRPTSAGDQVFVGEVAESLSLRFFTERLVAPPPDRNLEAWMREQRYDFLEKVRLEVGASLILTAHHAGDQDETLLMHLLTNRLPKFDSLGILFFDDNRHVFRPLLDCAKSDIESHVNDRGLKWVEDETNLDLGYLRNRVRREVLPFLQTSLNPSVTQALQLLANRIKTDEELIAKNLPDVRDFITEGLRLRPLIAMPVAARWRILRDYLQLVQPELVDRVSFNRLFAVASALDEYPDKFIVFELGDGISLELVSGGVLMVRVKGA